MTDTPFNDHRVERIEQLENEDVDPYPDVGDLDPSPISEFVAEYDNQDEIEGSDEWILAGRVTRSNEFGDFGFYDIDDRTGSVQVMCSVDERSDFETDNYDQLDHVNSGDWVVFTGFAGRSDTEELTLHAEEFEIASPSLQDTADDDWNQLGEQKRITQRTAALRTDDELFDTVGSRFDIENSVRTYLRQGGYTEVQTPILHNVAGGAEATPFETHCNALDRDVYLRIAPELYLKRLITAGYDNVFEMSRCFRNEDIDTTHNPEFTMMELYERFSTYEDMMELTENLFAHVAESLTGSTEVEYDGDTVEFAPPWERVTFDSLIEGVFSQSVDQIEREQVVEFLVERHEFEHYELEGSSFDDLLMEVFEEEIEPELDGPVFVQDYPASSTPLCRRDPDDHTRVQRFESFVLGMEIANSYTELIDPREQRQRLIEQAGGEDNINEEFVEALSHGMPPTAGLGIGIDRMAMLMTDSQSIKDVLAYPMTGSRV